MDWLQNAERVMFQVKSLPEPNPDQAIEETSHAGNSHPAFVVFDNKLTDLG